MTPRSLILGKASESQHYLKADVHQSADKIRKGCGSKLPFRHSVRGQVKESLFPLYCVLQESIRPEGIKTVSWNISGICGQVAEYMRVYKIGFRVLSASCPRPSGRAVEWTCNVIKKILYFFDPIVLWNKTNFSPHVLPQR